MVLLLVFVNSVLPKTFYLALYLCQLRLLALSLLDELLESLGTGESPVYRLEEPLDLHL
jgi:hypothetical protein